MNKLCLCILSHVFVFLSLNCIALTPTEEALLDNVNASKKQYMAAEEKMREERQIVDLDDPNIKGLRNLYNKSLETLISKAFEKNFEEENTLWNTLLSDPNFNNIILVSTLSRIKNKEFAEARKTKIIDILITNILRPEMKVLFSSNIEDFASIAVETDTMNNEQRTRIVNAMLQRNDSKINLLHYEALTPLFNAKTTAFFEKLAANAKDSYVPADSKYWLAVFILAHQGIPQYVLKIKNASSRIDSKHYNGAMSVPLGLAYSRRPELITVLFDMLKSDIEINKSGTIPPQTLSHTVAVALSTVIEGFPQYDYYLEFTPEDKKKCLEWVEKNKNNYKFIPRSSEYFYKETFLKMQ